MKWYAETHEWAEEKEGLVYVGISEHAAHALGDIVYISNPTVGETLVFGDRFGDVESVKAVSELFSPLNGKVVEVNESLEDAPEKLNENPLETWILKVEGTLDASKLMDEKTYLNTLKD
jgi:glycine cleavage system H protein